MPTPAIFAAFTPPSRSASAMDSRHSRPMRAMTASAPSSGRVASWRTPSTREPSSATVPTTMFVPPTSTPRIWRIYGLVLYPRMHLWWPSGQITGPCGWQGRHGIGSGSTMRESSGRAANPNCGTVGP